MNIINNCCRRNKKMTTVKNEINKGFLHFQTPFRIDLNKTKKVRKKMSIQKTNKEMASYNDIKGLGNG